MLIMLKELGMDFSLKVCLFRGCSAVVTAAPCDRLEMCPGCTLPLAQCMLANEISGLENGLMLVAVAVKDRLFLNSKTCTPLKKLTSVSGNFTFGVQTLHYKMHLTNSNVGSLLMQDK